LGDGESPLSLGIAGIFRCPATPSDTMIPLIATGTTPALLALDAEALDEAAD
jgi:hypothetical protein